MSSAAAKAAAKPAAPAPEAPAVKPSTKSASTVTVACKIPNGLELQLCRKTTFVEETPSGTRDRERWDRHGKTVTLRGPSVPVGAPPAGYVLPARIVGGFALTHNVDADFFDAWLEQNRENPIVTSGMIYAHSREENVAAFARENKASRSGHEPLVPPTDSPSGPIINDPRWPRRADGVGVITTADEMRDRQAFPAVIAAE